MHKNLIFLLTCILSFNGIYADQSFNSPVDHKVYIVGGGIIGALESYYAYKDAEKNGSKICVTVYEKGDSFVQAQGGGLSTNTACNIVPSLTIDEILSVVPRGSELAEKLAIPFYLPGGIRVDDVEGVNDSEAAINFKNAVTIYGADQDHDDRTLSLLTLGKKSMGLWQQMYNEGDPELRAILETSNFNPCRESSHGTKKVLCDGYRIDLIYGISDAKKYALGMQANYERMGYKHCAILSPNEVSSIDPYLVDFCEDHSILDKSGRIWKNDAVALWRPGGCIDAGTFLPRFYAYLKKNMGRYKDSSDQIQDCFQLRFSSEVTGVDFDQSSDKLRIVGLKFGDEDHLVENELAVDCRYVFCPGESVGTLQKFGFNEPAFASFAGPSLLITIPLSNDQIEKYRNFSQFMEVHKEGIVLAWQARLKDDHIFIGVGGTKAFYGDKQPKIDEEFAIDRNLVQLNMINHILPEFISQAYEYQANGVPISANELTALVAKGIAHRWVGRRAVAYDGFPTLGSLYCNGRRVSNARCTTHLGSGGVSFGPGAVYISRSSHQMIDDPFVQKILMYADSRRLAR